MQRWQTTYLGMRELPREISAFEMQAFWPPFVFDAKSAGSTPHI